MEMTNRRRRANPLKQTDPAITCKPSKTFGGQFGDGPWPAISLLDASEKRAGGNVGGMKTAC
jgi:hypothetical protein